MNIIIVHQWFKESATFKHIVYFANLMVKKGHKVLLISHKDRGSPYDITDEVLFEYKTCEISINRLEKNFIKYIQGFKPDIIHSFCNQYVVYISVLIKKATDAKLIVHYEDNHEQIFFNNLPFFKVIKLLLSGLFFLNIWEGYNLLLEWRLRKYFDGYDTLTNNLKKMLKNKSVNKPVQQIYPPIDLEFFNPDVDGTYLRKKLDLNNKFVLLHSGTVYCHWMEGFDKFLQGVALARKQIPEIKLVFTGRKIGNVEKLFEIINKYKLDDIVSDLGYLKNFSEMPAYLAMADILFEPQMNQGFDEYRLPSKIHNYMAAGKPIITFSNGFVTDLTDDEVVKIDFSSEQAEIICNKIIFLYENADVRKKLGTNARKKAELMFDKNNNTDELLKYYDYILSKS